MSSTDIHLFDMPNEILYNILNKLDNMSVLYSLIGIGNQRLEQIAQDKVFTSTLHFESNDLYDASSFNDSMLNRFCRDILVRIEDNVTCLIIDSLNIERILLAANYHNLREIKIFNFSKDTAFRCFTDELLWKNPFRQQITRLTLVNIDEQLETHRNYTANVYVRIFNSFENLTHFNVVRQSINECPPLLLRDLPLTTFYSSTLTTLCVSVLYFQDCLFLLDGRLKQLITLVVSIDCVNNDSFTLSNSSYDLPYLKSFSLTYTYISYQYDTEILPLLRRMCNLEVLILYLIVDGRPKFIDGTQLHREILINMPQLHTFNFYISTRILSSPSVKNLSHDEIHRTFTDIGYEQVASIIYNVTDNHTICNIFSLPFAFDRLEMIGNNFPTISFRNVTHLLLDDEVPFKHEFFIRIAHSFPLLKYLTIVNHHFQIIEFDQFESFNENHAYTIVEYPHLTRLNLRHAHICYAEQFLHQSKAHLPRLTEFEIRYDHLTLVTENFTRAATRQNCRKVKRLITNEEIACRSDLYLYFPVLKM